MAAATLPDDTKKPSPNENAGESEINSPEIDPKTGKPTQKAVKNFKQASSICKALREPALNGRIDTAAKVAKQYNGALPHNPKQLEDANQEFRNNFSTQFLPSVVDRVKPQLMDPLMRADRITYATMRPTRENAAEKSRKFGEGITKLVRSWPGWSDFLSLLCQDDVLHGSSIAVRLTPDDWRPRVARFDEAFMHDGVGQHSTKVPCLMIEQKLLIHEFVDLISDKSAAEAAGYKIAGCAKAANRAAGLNVEMAEETALAKEESIREGTGILGHSYKNNTKTVNLWHLLVREYTGGIALWTTNTEGDEIRHVDNLFDNMPDCASLFTAQTGNGRFYGSKGLGRYLVNLAMAIERLRCLQADQAAMNGMPIAKGDPTQFNGQSVLVHAPFIVVDASFEMEPNLVLKYNLGELQAVIDKLTEIAESIAGAFIPPNITNEGSPNTKIEAAQKAEREMAVRQGVLGRFFGQFADLMGMMQRGICSPENIGEAARIYEEWKQRKAGGATMMLAKVYHWLKRAGSVISKALGAEPIPSTKIADVEAVDALVEMMIAGLTPEDIAELALADAGSTVSQNTEERDTMTVQMLQAEAQNPYLDQHAATLMRFTLAIGEDRARQVVLKDQEDPNVEAVAYRQQMFENFEMWAGEAMPVASTDNHALHKKVIAEKMIQKLSPALDQAPDPNIISVFKLALQHYADHIELDTTAPEPQKKQELEIVKQLASKVQAAETAVQLAQAAGNSTGTLTGPPNTPPGTPAPTANPEPSETDKMVHAADIGLRAQDQQLRAKELDLKAQQQAHQQQMDVHKVGLDADAQAHDQQVNVANIQDQRAASIVEQANVAHEQGMKEAAHDLAVQSAKDAAKASPKAPGEAK